MKFEQLLLRSFKNLRGERSAANIFHLLKGKRSIQTIQDAHLFSLEKYYGVYKNLTKTNFDKSVEYLVGQKLIEKNNELGSAYTITNNGLEFLEKAQDELFFNGLAYFEKTDVFNQRLLLFIQTLTNTKMKFTSFIPVVNNKEIEQWVKSIYKRIKGLESTILNKLYEELQTILNHFTEMEAAIFVDRLSGYQLYGLSIYQIQQKFSISMDDVYLILQSIIHRILFIIEANESKYPILASFIDRSSELALMTKSARETFRLLLKGYSIENIATMRKLKENTIHDHLVEIAFYYNNFPIRDFVTEEEEREILRALEQSNSQRLKSIKELVNGNITYFQIRLIIALENKRKQEDNYEFRT